MKITTTVSGILLLVLGHAAFGQTIDGILEPKRNVTIKTMIDGTIESMPHVEGTFVVPNTIIAELDNAEQGAKVMLARTIADATSRTKSALHRSKVAKRKLSDLEAAQVKGAATDWEVFDAKAAATLARLEWEAENEKQIANHHRLALEKELLARYSFTAPFAGTLTEIFVVPGQSISRGESIARLVNTNVLEFEAFVDAEHFSLLERNKVYSGEIGEPFNRSFEASLTHIDSVFDSATGSIRVVFTIDNTENLPAGMNAVISLKDQVHSLLLKSN